MKTGYLDWFYSLLSGLIHPHPSDPSIYGLIKRGRSSYTEPDAVHTPSRLHLTMLSIRFIVSLACLLSIIIHADAAGQKCKCVSRNDHRY